MARYLLLPEDEEALHHWITAELGLLLVTGPVVDGVPTRVRTDASWWRLPKPAMPFDHSGPPRELVYWREGWSANDLPGWGEGTPQGRVGRRLNENAGLTDGWLDLERTRVVCWRRCGWTGTGALHVGMVHGSARPKALADPEVQSLVRRVERRLQAGAVRVSLPESVVFRPAIFAQREAAEWLASGGEVWPWDG